MRSCSLIVAIGLGLCLLVSAGLARAATIKGSVVDSTGRPVAGAHVRIWQIYTAAAGNVIDEQLKFGGNETLTTGADGQFAIPDVLADAALVWIVAEADGMLAGRSGWIDVSKDASVNARDIVLRRLRPVIGQVIDRKGQPVAGVNVFNSGDGHERVETRTGRNGKFLLPRLPEGKVFLFAEKPGYRFTGTFFDGGQRDARLILTGSDEQEDPLNTLSPLISPEEESKLARESIDIEDVATSGSDAKKLSVLAALAEIDPLEAVMRLDSFNIENKHARGFHHDKCVETVAANPERLGIDKLIALIESGEDQLGMTRAYVAAARHFERRSSQTKLFDYALSHAQRVELDDYRVLALALAADALFFVGDKEQAALILAEAQRLADLLQDSPRAKVSLAVLALATANNDAESAVAWLEKTKGTRGRVFATRGGELALRLVAKRPELAVQVWNRALEPDGPWDGPRTPPQPTTFYSRLPDFCYRLAVVDLASAERVADAAETAAMRVRAQGAIALALSETQPEAARQCLESLVRDKLALVASDTDSWFRSWTAPGTAAWLLPIAERVAPDLCREVFWRSLALRPPRPQRDHFDGHVEEMDRELAKMLARYDRDIARAVLEQQAEQLPQTIALATMTNDARHAVMAAGEARQEIQEVIVAAVHVDAHWATKLLDATTVTSARLPRPIGAEARQYFISTLARHGCDRWDERNWLCAGFWKPRTDNEMQP